MNTMFDTLLELPLFQGLCHEDFTTIIEKIKLHFSRHKKGNIVIKQNGACKQLAFLLKGTLILETVSKDGMYSFVEYIDAPAVIEPQALFGMKLRYRSSYLAKTEVNMVSISKSFILYDLMQYDVFRLNYMNMISNGAQITKALLWLKIPANTEEKIINFILMHSNKTPGTKALRVKMDDLARCINDSRLNTSKTLKTLHEKQLIELRRKEIIIHDIYKLYAEAIIEEEEEDEEEEEILQEEDDEN